MFAEPAAIRSGSRQMSPGRAREVKAGTREANSRPDLVGTARGDGAGFVGEDDGLDAVAQAELRQ